MLADHIDYKTSFKQKKLKHHHTSPDKPLARLTRFKLAKSKKSLHNVYT